MGTTAGVRVIARARGRSNTVRAMSVMCEGARLPGLPLRALGRSLLLKTSAASRLRGTSGGLLSSTLSRLSRTLRRLRRALARLSRARHGLP